MPPLRSVLMPGSSAERKWKCRKPLCFKGHLIDLKARWSLGSLVFEHIIEITYDFYIDKLGLSI